MQLERESILQLLHANLALECFWVQVKLQVVEQVDHGRSFVTAKVALEEIVNLLVALAIDFGEEHSWTETAFETLPFLFELVKFHVGIDRALREVHSTNQTLDSLLVNPLVLLPKGDVRELFAANCTEGWLLCFPTDLGISETLHGVEYQLLLRLEDVLALQALKVV